MQDGVDSSPSEYGRSKEVSHTRTPGGENDASASSSEQRAPTNATAYLSGLSELAGHSFASTQEAVEAILQLIVDKLGLRSSFLTHISREECQEEILVAYNLVDGSDIQSGVKLELPQTF
jgi:hypothetical protein